MRTLIHRGPTSGGHVSPLSNATAAQIKTLPLEQLEALADALLDFSGPADLAAWLAEHSG